MERGNTIHQLIGEMVYCANCSANYFVYQYLVCKEKKAMRQVKKRQAKSKQSSSTFYVEPPM